MIVYWLLLFKILLSLSSLSLSLSLSSSLSFSLLSLSMLPLSLLLSWMLYLLAWFFFVVHDDNVVIVVIIIVVVVVVIVIVVVVVVLYVHIQGELQVIFPARRSGEYRVTLWVGGREVRSSPWVKYVLPRAPHPPSCKVNSHLLSL